MAVIPIIKIPNQVLLQKAIKVDKFDQELKQLVVNLKDTLENARNPEGAGLAANQVGSLKRVVVVRNFVYHTTNTKDPIIQTFVLVNPKIISKSKELETDWEACLSIPDTYGRVERYSKIKVRAQDEDGQEFQIKAHGYFAAVIQHEIDHLDGILFTSKIIGKPITEKELDKIIKYGN